MRIVRFVVHIRHDPRRTIVHEGIRYRILMWWWKLCMERA